MSTGADKNKTLLHYSYYDPHKMIGGFETLVRESSEKQASLGYEVYVLCRGVDQKELLLQYKKNGVKYITVRCPRKLGYTTPRLGIAYFLTVAQNIAYVIPFLIYALVKFKPEVIFFYKEPVTSPLAVICNLFRKTPILCHFVFHKELKKTMLEYWFYKLLLSPYKKYITFTDEFHSSDKVISNLNIYKPLVAPKEVVYLPYGIPAESPIHTRFSNPNIIQYELSKKTEKAEHVVFLSPRRMTLQKGVHILYDAILKGYPNVFTKNNVSFVFCGDGELRKPLELDAERRGLVNKLIYFTGVASQEQMQQYFEVADVVVIPSLSEEDYGIAVLEAYRSNSAVIASKFGGLPGIVEDGVTGLFFPPGDSLALYETMKTLAENPDLRKTLASAGHKKFTLEYTMDTYMKKLMAIVYSAEVTK